MVHNATQTLNRDIFNPAATLEDLPLTDKIAQLNKVPSYLSHENQNVQRFGKNILDNFLPEVGFNKQTRPLFTGLLEQAPDLFFEKAKTALFEDAESRRFLATNAFEITDAHPSRGVDFIQDCMNQGNEEVSALFAYQLPNIARQSEEQKDNVAPLALEYAAQKRESYGYIRHTGDTYEYKGTKTHMSFLGVMDKIVWHWSGTDPDQAKDICDRFLDTNPEQAHLFSENFFSEINNSQGAYLRSGDLSANRAEVALHVAETMAALPAYEACAEGDDADAIQTVWPSAGIHGALHVLANSYADDAAERVSQILNNFEPEECLAYLENHIEKLPRLYGYDYTMDLLQEAVTTMDVDDEDPAHYSKLIERVLNTAETLDPERSNYISYLAQQNGLLDGANRPGTMQQSNPQTDKARQAQQNLAETLDHLGL